MGDHGPSVRALDRGDESARELVAHRLHLTLAEVLGEERAAGMFTHEALRERVRFHLEPPASRRAAVFVADVEGEALAGHAMVRVETERPDRVVGLLATIYVTPAARRRGVASALLRRAEAWFRGEAMSLAVTYTDRENERLLAFLRANGWTTEVLDESWARGQRLLEHPPPTPLL